MSWKKQDQAVANIFNNFNNGDFAAFSAGIIKPLPTGGVANITFDTNYTKLANVPQGFAVINPSYTPSVDRWLRAAAVCGTTAWTSTSFSPQHPGSTQLKTTDRPAAGPRASWSPGSGPTRPRPNSSAT